MHRIIIKMASCLQRHMSEAESPPTPDGLPILGNGWAFTRDPIDAMETWAKHGDLVRLRFLGESMYLVTHPDLIRQILVEEQHKFEIGPEQQRTFEGIEDHAMTTATGGRWQRLRRAAHPAFTRESIAEYGDRMGAVSARFVDEWRDGEAFDLHREMRLLTVQVLAETLLNEDIRGEEAIVLDAADAFIARTNFRRPGQMLPDWIPTPTERRFRSAVNRLDEYVDSIIEQRQHSEAEGAEDVCSILLEAHEAGDLVLPEVKHNLVAFLLAGHESPAGALTRVWYLLADHPEITDLLREEAGSVLDGAPATVDDYEKLEYTGDVIKETLRLYPPTTGVNRQAVEAVELDGYELEAGAQFLIPQWIPHRDERFWDRPERFDPERWRRDSDRPEYAFFPFSGGPRACIGSDFARQELTLALATMVDRVELDVDSDGPLRFIPSIQLRPANDITATVRRR
jgi:cytochrome P450